MDRWAAARSRGHLVCVDGRRGFVTARLDSSVYVEVAGSDLLVLHDSSHGHTPTSILLDRSAEQLRRVRHGDTVVGRAGHLKVGDVVVDVRAVSVWTPPAAPRNGVAGAAHVCGTPSITAGDADALVGALMSGADLQAPLARLVGRGPGLTPSGDDAIVGILAVLHRATPCPVAEPWIHQLAAALAPMFARTTPISAHYLRLALRGHFSERLVAMVDGLADASGPHPEHLQQLVSTGATSGADALAGVMCALPLARTHPTLKDVA